MMKERPFLSLEQGTFVQIYGIDHKGTAGHGCVGFDSPCL